ncbi:GtrA family protein [Ramlibacter sp.]|uniref:GtrA family protein n=1 Tax=Ramlibacter sp. TaxID=1917967 RepID=UPI00184DE5C6|nr:GtrA family protein [Ramlibacter sp.]MBA2676485.1 GtrA family protein [Ramlibacter sp.]
MATALASEKVRFIAAGLWNTFFGWAAFSALWLLCHTWSPLWLIAAAAHLAATTQAFAVQRQLVFVQGRTGRPVLQFLRFQLAYAVQLVLGVLLISAAAAQGVHPLVAQPLALLLLAVGGFFMGRDFVFTTDSPQPSNLLRRSGDWVRRHAAQLVFFVLSLAAFERFWGSRFYTSLDHVGHDFTLSALALLEGRWWVQSNGFIGGMLNPPWFTPAWCGGTAFYADPQAAFYSPLQLFALWVDPFTASHLNALLFAGVAFWGGYLLVRRVFGWNVAGGILFGALGMANAFMPLRSAVGELGYQPLYLWTWLVLALCWPAARNGWRSWLAGPAIGVALCLTAWLQFGFGGMLVPAFLAAVLLCLVAVAAGKTTLVAVLARAAAGGFGAILLNASKLYESISLMRNFPRDFYGMPGFASLADALMSALFALVQPSQWTAIFASTRMQNVRFTVLPHEWNLNFGWGALCLACIACVVLLARANRSPGARPPPASASPSQVTALAGIVVLLAIPLLLMWSNGAVQEGIKRIPILNSTAWPMRWVVVYLPLAQLLLAWPFEKLMAFQADARGGRPWQWTGAALVLVWAGPATEPVDYYLSSDIQAYDPKPVLQAFHRSSDHGPVPITSIALPTGQPLFAHRNDTMLAGASQGLCYNPIYGYRLESFPQPQRLREGPALAVDASGRSLLLNPACLVHPDENQCKPGDGFSVGDPAQRREAEMFLGRHPFQWQRPALGRYLSLVSQFSFGLLAVLLCLRLGMALRTRPPAP